MTTNGRRPDSGTHPADGAAVDSPATLPDWVMPWPEFTIDWRRSALLVIDVQNYSSNVRVGLAQMLAEQRPTVAAYYADRIGNVMVPNIARLIAGFRSVGREVIYTRHGALLPDGRDMILRRRRRDADATAQTSKPALWPLGSYEHDVIDELKPETGELVVDKNSSSPFNGTGIDQLLRNMGLDTLVLSGTATDMCVETTARDAGDRGYNVIVAEDATGTYFHAHHVAALSGIARVFGQVWDTTTILDALTAGLGSGRLEASEAPTTGR